MLVHAWECLEVVAFGLMSFLDSEGTVMLRLASSIPSVTMVHFLLKQHVKSHFPPLFLHKKILLGVCEYLKCQIRIGIVIDI